MTMMAQCKHCEMTVMEVTLDTEIIDCKFCGKRTKLDQM